MQGDELVASVEAALTDLRSHTGRLSPSAVAEHEPLMSLYGNGDAYDLWQWMQQVATLEGMRSREVRAASLSIFNEHKTVLDRLTHTGNELFIDQRHARRLSNAGIRLLARALVDSAHLTGDRALNYVTIGWARGSKGNLVLAVRWLNVTHTPDTWMDFYVGDLIESNPRRKRIRWSEAELSEDGNTARFYLVLPEPATFDYADIHLALEPVSVPYVSILNTLEVDGQVIAPPIVHRSVVSFGFAPLKEVLQRVVTERVIDVSKLFD